MQPRTLTIRELRAALADLPREWDDYPVYAVSNRPPLANLVGEPARVETKEAQGVWGGDLEFIDPEERPWILTI